MWQRFSESLRRVIFFAQEAAARHESNDVGTEHLLHGLLRANAESPLPILDALDASPDAIAADLKPFLTDRGDTLGEEMRMTPGAKTALDLAYEEAKHAGQNTVNLSHLLAGLAQEGEPSGTALSRSGIDADRVRDAIHRLQGNPEG